MVEDAALARRLKSHRKLSPHLNARGGFALPRSSYSRSQAKHGNERFEFKQSAEKSEVKLRQLEVIQSANALKKSACNPTQQLLPQQLN